MNDQVKDVVLGIDASLTHTGVAITAMVDSTHMEETFRPKKRDTERLLEIEVWIDNLLRRMKEQFNFNLKLVVIEGYAYTPRFGQSFSLGELGGIIKLYFYKHDIPLLIVQPQTLKKWITGIGKGDKNMILLKAFRKYNIEFADDHTCDAFGLAMIGKELYQIQQGKKDIKTSYAQYEQEVLKLIKKQMKEDKQDGKEEE